jgi:hypothetical protein
LSKAVKALGKWVMAVHMIQAEIDDQVKIRWRDTIEEPEEEQEADALELIKNLSESDPNLYRKRLEDSLQNALSAYEKSVVEAANVAVKEQSSTTVLRPVLLLRAVRISWALLEEAFSSQTKDFDALADAVSELHGALAEEVVRRLTDITATGKNLPGSTTYGKTALPENMPSPRAFSVLRRLCKIMLETGGTDIWSGPAVALVKKAVGARIFDPEHQANYMENDFDEGYLRTALDHNVEGKLVPAGTASELEAPKKKQHIRPEQEYWERTKLLFGVLA